MNPVLRDLEPDAEALIVNRTSDPPAFAIAPDRPLLHARRPDQGVVGGHLGRRRDGARRSRRYFDELRAVAA